MGPENSKETPESSISEAPGDTVPMAADEVPAWAAVTGCHLPDPAIASLVKHLDP
jgi:hypothetical protein